MRYLLDANVVLEPTKLTPAPQVLDWLESNRREFAVDSIVLAELKLGILGLPPGKKRQRLDEWLQSLTERIVYVPWDAATGFVWAELTMKLRRQGKSIPILDSMIAASALRHNLTLVTRNVRDFQSSGVRLFNPFLRGGK